MHTISMIYGKGNYKPVLLISLLTLSVFAMGVPYATSKPPVTASYAKISHTLLSMIEAQGCLPVNVLISTTSHDYASVVADIQRLGGHVKNQFQYVNALAASVPADKILTLAENENIVKIYYDETRSLAGVLSEIPELDPKPETASSYLAGYDVVSLTPEMIGSVEPNNYWNPVAMGAEPVWDLNDYGQDSMVVIIDTGLWAGHFMFEGSSIIGGVDLSPDVGTEYEGWNRSDNHWHGTHVAGIIASTGGIVLPEDDS